MEMATRKYSIQADDGAAVLSVLVTYPCGVSECVDSFYRELAEAFEISVTDVLSKSAKEAYLSDTDRRKRYRYKTWQTSFSVIPKDSGYELTIHKNEKIILSEQHLWDGDIIKKRLKKAKSTT